MARRRRDTIAFNLSFLDIMSCGFGAVVLVYLIMNHAVEQRSEEENTDLLAEVSLLEEDIRRGEEGLVQLRNSLAQTDQRTAEAAARAERIARDKAALAQRAAQAGGDGSDRADIATLKADLQTLEKKVADLRREQEQSGGQSARSFTGDGDRQYLTGLNLGGSHIAILLDSSASMLADQLVQIIRLRNMETAVQRRAAKWVRSLATVDWLLAQMPVAAHYQVLTFNTDVSFALRDSAGEWLEVADQAALAQVSTALRELVPAGGTSLARAFLALEQLQPAPDNIFLITDGLPTQGRKPARRSKVSGKERQKLYREALQHLPQGVPVNIILAPLEGDPMAAAEFWQLAQRSGGTLLSPSRDWP